MNERRERSAAMLKEQLKPRGMFGINGDNVYSTGNGQVTDVGWIGRGGADHDINQEATASTQISRLNMAPPVLHRGASYIASLGIGSFPCETNHNSEVSEHHVGGQDDPENWQIFYVDDQSWTYSQVPPEEGVNTVKVWKNLEDFQNHVEINGYYDPSFVERTG